MRKHASVTPGTFLTLVALVALVLCAASASAHKINIFATAQGDTIVGYVYSAGGARMAGVAVHVLGPGDALLAELRTDDQGEFSYKASHRSDHWLEADTADGHSDRFLVEATELPASLPPAPGADALSAKPPLPTAHHDVPTSTGLEAIVARAVADQVRPLREQIDEMQEKIGLRDILGGVGFLLGAAGIAFYFLGVRRIESRRNDGDPPSRPAP